MEDQIDIDLSAIYFNADDEAAFGGVSRLYKAVKDRGLGYTLKEVKDWLQTQEVYSSFKPVNHNIARPKVIVPDKFYQLDTDTVNMTRYSKQNKGYKYILIIIDIFTRYLFTQPLYSLTGKEMSKTLEYVLQTYNIHPQRVRSDKGSEFISKFVQDFFRENNIIHFTSTNEVKANIAERVIKTLKAAITKHMFQYKNKKWVDILQEVTKAYNNRYHRSIKMSPAKALVTDKSEVFFNQYYTLKNFHRGPNKRKDTPEFRFNLEDRVKLAKFRTAFQREYDQKWTTEVFIIINRQYDQGIPVYQVKDYLNIPIIGKFYENELEKVGTETKSSFKVEKVIREEKKGTQKGFIVSWKGREKDDTTWLPASWFDTNPTL